MLFEHWFALINLIVLDKVLLFTYNMFKHLNVTRGKIHESKKHGDFKRVYSYIFNVTG